MSVKRRRGSIRRATWTTSATLAVLSLGTASASAEGGRLDPAFGEDGRVATTVALEERWKDTRVQIATSSDGAVVVASGTALLRYLPSGELDRNFGRGGRLTVDAIDGLSFEFGDVAVDHEDRIVAFGTVVSDTSVWVNKYGGGFAWPAFVVVLRYDTSGRPDPSFGGGDGVVRTDLGLRPLPNTATPTSLVRTVAGEVDREDRPVLVAALEEMLQGEVRAYLGWQTRAVARLTAAGELDPGFGGGDGVALLSSVRNRGVAIDPLDSSLLAWGSPASDRQVLQVTRLRDDGTAVETYGTDGMRTVPGGGSGAAIDPFGRLLSFAGYGPRTEVLRLRGDGSVDRGFGRRGSATVRAPGGWEAFGSIAVDSGGRALLAGSGVTRALGRRGDDRPREFLSVVRLRASGELDRGFGHEGRVRTGFGTRTEIAPAHGIVNLVGSLLGGPQATIDAKGRLVVAGVARSAALPKGGLVLARYLLGR